MDFLARFKSSLALLQPNLTQTQFVVAYSGGLDSHVLLHCCVQLKLAVRAIHIHHGLQAVADDWVVHCQKICRELDVEISTIFVDAKQKKRESPEESARHARYQALSEHLKKGECLLTAQHLNDQAETVLLQLFRSANSAGLAAMPAVKQLKNALHIRPLLHFTRQEILTYATQQSLKWVEDPSNQDLSLDRNYLRQSIFPALNLRWQNVAKQLATVAGLQANNHQVLQDMAAIDLANIIMPQKIQQQAIFRYQILSVLSIPKLQALSNARRYNLLRYWLLAQNQHIKTNFVVKNSHLRKKLLDEIDKTLITHTVQSRCVVNYQNLELRQYQQHLYLLKPLISNPEKIQQDFSFNQPQKIESLNINLHLNKTEKGGLNNNLLKQSLTITWRKGGERFQPKGRVHSQQLKKLLQQENIPPWERQSFPLLYCNDELITVIGLWNSQKHSVLAEKVGWTIEIKPNA